MSMLTATKVAAIATGILALFAIVTAIVAGLTLRKQSTQVELLKEQAKRDTDQRRRAQVSRVFLWNAYGPLMFTASDDDDPDVSLHTSVHLKNTSDQPVYDIMFTWHYDHHTVPGRHVRQLMPGMDLKDDPPRGVADQLPASTRLYADATFRDAASVRWRRGQGGQLDELLPGQ